MESYRFLMIIAIILLSTKIFGLLSQKVHMPQVIGALLAGLILGPSVLNVIGETDFLLKASELGVIALMFLAGLDTDLDELKKTGKASLLIALLGVVIPLIAGFFTYKIFLNNTSDPLNFLKAVFTGIVLTATSVSITVETLREMGKLKGKVGTAILGAAIIDDILGIIVLTFAISFTDNTVKLSSVILRILLFFVFVGIVGYVMHIVFEKMDKTYGKKRRVAIYGFAFCLIMSFVAEEFFGIADITGAYFAGLIICNIDKTKNYIASKITVVSYMVFSPMFFASIGIKTQLSGFSPELIGFSVVLLIVALITKVVGCGLGAKLCKFSTSDSLKVGIGMISRGEVALIMAQKGAAAGLISVTLFPPIIIVVVATTLITPVLLKLVMKDNDDDDNPIGMHHHSITESP